MADEEISDLVHEWASEVLYALHNNTPQEKLALGTRASTTEKLKAQLLEAAGPTGRVIRRLAPSNQIVLGRVAGRGGVPICQLLTTSSSLGWYYELFACCDLLYPRDDMFEVASFGPYVLGRYVDTEMNNGD